MPRRSQRLKEKSDIKAEVKLSNRFVLPTKDQPTKQSTEEGKKKGPRPQTPEIVHNLSAHKLSPSELSLLEKGLNFCPSSPTINTEQLLDDVHAYCRKQRLKYKSRDVNAENDDHPPNSNNSSETERCDMKSIYRNPYYDPVDDSECANLEKYLACIK